MVSKGTDVLSDCRVQSTWPIQLIPKPCEGFLKNIFIYLAVPGLSCGMRDLVPWPGIKPGPPALGAQSLSHWATREVPRSYLFIYFWLCWVFVDAHGLSLVVVIGGYSSLQWAGFSLRWLLLLRSRGSRRAGFSSCGTRALEHRLSRCGSRA